MKNVIKFSSKIENLRYAENIVEQIADSNQISAECYGNILVSLTEAVSNCIVHGNNENPKKNVTVAYEIDNNKIEFTVSDEGGGFDYKNIPDPTAPENLEKPYGRGIFLMKHLSDNVVYSNKGATVKMIFNF